VKPVLPGAAIGVLGSGQLGRMFAIAARGMGYRVHTLSPDTDTPTGQVADVEVTADYGDLDAVRRFARGVDVVTFEFENVQAQTVEALEQLVPVRPAGRVLHTTQQRIREKTFLVQAGLPLAPFRAVRSLAELKAAIAEIGCPAVLKTARFGYDGKGQAVVPMPESAEGAWAAVGGEEAVLEAFVDFECELSVVAARGADGEFAHYGALENRHANHILDLTVAPGRVPPRVARDAVEIARALLDKLEVVGVLCVEMFLTRGGRLLVNELAPRPHNSGHFTFDACVTSQFEQQLRAVCGLRLGSTQQMRAAASANLLGDLWAEGEPDWAAACAHSDVKLHLYGKHEARPGRKMGHLTALAATAGEALEKALSSRGALVASPSTAGSRERSDRGKSRRAGSAEAAPGRPTRQTTPAARSRRGAPDCPPASRCKGRCESAAADRRPCDGDIGRA
jgi:5-(carboxyamino)imidazole ribonucleotide synthase